MNDQEPNPLVRISQNAQFVLRSDSSILSHEASAALWRIINDARDMLARTHYTVNMDTVNVDELLRNKP
jgi:hypothetical protein